MGDEELPADKIGFFHYLKLFFTNAPVVKGVIVVTMSILGLGTVTNPMIQEQVASVFKSEPEEPLPTTDTVVPTESKNYDSFHAQVRQSLESMKRSIDAQGAKLNLVVEELDAVEARREVESQADDKKLDEKVQKNSAAILFLKGLVN